MSVFVEITIRGSIDELWRRTQQPELHEQWDLRFSRITYLPRGNEAEPQQFHYATRIGFGVSIVGAGESVGSKNEGSGIRTSALKFWSNDRKSLIRDGAGYWQYIPNGDKVRFLTSYDYQVRFGRFGRMVDHFMFRPLMAWATAWSFDRLRLWVESGVDPVSAMRRWCAYQFARFALAFVWIYQGAIPKLIYQHADEMSLLDRQGFSAALAPTILTIVGVCEVLLGVTILAQPAVRWPYWLSIILMVAATVSVAVTSPTYLFAAFNPASLNVAVGALAGISLVVGADLPSARRAIWSARGK